MMLALDIIAAAFVVVILGGVIAAWVYIASGDDTF